MFNGSTIGEKRIFLIIPLLILTFLFTFGYKEISAEKTINFSGYIWQVKHSIHHSVGPGPNYFSASGRNVRIDEDGNLHLRLHEHKGRWYSTEVWLERALGYGTYSFTVKFPQGPLDENVVLGMFHYLNDGQELDIEISKWGEDTSKNAGFSVQPVSLKKITIGSPWTSRKEREKSSLSLGLKTGWFSAARIAKSLVVSTVF